MTGTEIPLGGGNMSSGVVRVGDTMRARRAPRTPAVHALLTHLHEVGFSSAPRPLGIDDRGREVLTFMPGTVAWPGHFHLLDADRQLRRAARLMREFHDAVAGFAPPPDARWQALMPADGDKIIAHHDLAPWNLVIGDRDGRSRLGHRRAGHAALGPGVRHARVRAADADPAVQRDDASRRLRLLADAYGLTERRRLTSSRCSPAAPGPCTRSSRARPPGATSHGHGYGRRVTATPGRPTPATSPSAKPGGIRRLSASSAAKGR